MVEILFYDVRQSLAPLNEEEMVQRKRKSGGGIDIPLLEKQLWKTLHKKQIVPYLTQCRITLFAELGSLVILQCLPTFLAYGPNKAMWCVFCGLV